MRLLLLAPFPYGPGSGHGGAIVCFAMLKQLAKDHEVQVLCFSTGTSQDVAAVDEMRRYAQVHLVPLRITKGKVLGAKLKTWLQFRPEGAIYYESEAYRTALVLTEDQLRPDVVVSQFPQMAQYLQFVRYAARAHDVQDAFSVSWFRRACSATTLRKPYAFWQWLVWLVYERHYYALANQCWTLSVDDSYGLKVFSPALDAFSVGIPLLELVGSAIETSRTDREAPVIGFIASYGHAPNVEALECIVREIAPTLRLTRPDACIRIAGRNPPSALVQSAPANVEFIGFVDSLEAFYTGCDLIVAPLLSGGGVKIKVIEAMGFGKAVVTTSVGAEGIGIANTGACAVVSAAAMPALLVELINDAPRRRRMEAAARALAVEQFSAEPWRSRVNARLQQLAADRCQVVKQGELS